MSQLRKFFGAIRKIEKETDEKKIAQELIMLRPRLAYSAARAEKKSFSKFSEKLQEGLEAISKLGATKARLKNLVHLMEAVVAYHKEKETEIKAKSSQQYSQH